MKARIETLKARVQMVVDLMPDEMTADQIDSLLCPIMDTLDDVIANHLEMEEQSLAQAKTEARSVLA